MSDESKLPVLEYPGTYTFRVVVLEGSDVRDQVRTIVGTVLGVPVPASAMIDQRAQGKYVSLHITCELQSEEQRVAVYGQLQAQPFVKFML